MIRVVFIALLFWVGCPAIVFADVKVASKLFAFSTVDSVQSVTISGVVETPAAAIVQWNRRAVDGIDREKAEWGMAFATENDEEGVTSLARDNNVQTFIRSRQDSVTSINGIDNAAEGEISLIPGGIEINWTGQPTSTAQASLVIFYGSDVSADVGSVLVDSGVEITETLLNVDPSSENAIGFFTSITVTNEETSNSRMSIGVAVNDAQITQNCLTFTSLHNKNPSDENSMMNADFTAGRLWVTTASVQAAITNFSGPNSFGITRTISNNVFPVKYLIVGVGPNQSVWTGFIDSPTTTGDWNVQDPGFKPQHVGIMAGNNTAVNVTDRNTGVSYFFASEVTEDSFGHTTGFGHVDAVSPSQTWGWVNDLFSHYDGASGEIRAIGTFSSFTATGWTINISSENISTPQKWLAWAIEDEFVPVAKVVNVGSKKFAFDTAAPTQDVVLEGVTETPKGAMVVWNMLENNGVFSRNQRGGFGFSDGTNEWANSWRAVDNAGTTQTSRGNSDVYAVWGTNNSPQGNISFIPGGIRISWVTNAPDPYAGSVTMFWGSDVSVDVGSQQISDGTDTITLSTVDPATENVMAFFASSGLNTISANTSHVITSFGAADNFGALDQAAVFIENESTVSVAVPTSYVSDNKVVGQYFRGVMGWSAMVSNFTNTNQINLNVTGSAGNDYFGYMAVGLGTSTGAWVGVEDSPITTGPWSVASPGFQPQAIRISPSIATSLDVSALGYGLSVYGATDQAQAPISGTLGFGSEHNADPTNEWLWADTRLAHYNGTSATPDVVGNVLSFNADGWTFFITEENLNTPQKWMVWAIDTGGAQPPVGNVQSIDGVIKSNIKSIDGVDNANIKSIDGVAF